MQKCDETRVSWDYFDRFEKLVREIMPREGEGETMASQMVTAVNKLVYKWYNDGDVFDNTYGLQGWANDLSTYANWLYKYIPETRSILNTIEDATLDGEYEILLKDLANKTLKTKMVNQYKTKEKVDSIYECQGKFKFVEYYEDDYEM